MTSHIFCFASCSMYELRNSYVFIGKLHEHIGIRTHLTTYCILSAQGLCMCNAQTSEQKPITKNFAGLHNHFPLFTMPLANIMFIM